MGVTHDGTVKLLDLGYAGIVRVSDWRTDEFELTGETGSPRYIAPEVFHHKPCVRSRRARPGA